MLPCGILLSDDLIFSSKVTATARAHGVSVTIARTWAALLARASEVMPSAIILDLNHPELKLAELHDWLATFPHLNTVGYGSHVDTARLQGARDVGVRLVMPRSKFVRDLEVELKNWLTTPTQQGETNALHEDARTGQ